MHRNHRWFESVCCDWVCGVKRWKEATFSIHRNPCLNSWQLLMKEIKKKKRMKNTHHRRGNSSWEKLLWLDVDSREGMIGQLLPHSIVGRRANKCDVAHAVEAGHQIKWRFRNLVTNRRWRGSVFFSFKRIVARFRHRVVLFWVSSIPLVGRWWQLEPPSITVSSSQIDPRVLRHSVGLRELRRYSTLRMASATATVVAGVSHVALLALVRRVLRQ